MNPRARSSRATAESTHRRHRVSQCCMETAQRWWPAFTSGAVRYCASRAMVQRCSPHVRRRSVAAVDDFDAAANTPASPIVTVNLWLDREVPVTASWPGAGPNDAVGVR